MLFLFFFDVWIFLGKKINVKVISGRNEMCFLNDSWYHLRLFHKSNGHKKPLLGWVNSAGVDHVQRMHQGIREAWWELQVIKCQKGNNTCKSRDHIPQSMECAHFQEYRRENGFHKKKKLLDKNENYLLHKKFLPNQQVPGNIVILYLKHWKQSGVPLGENRQIPVSR